MSVSGHFRVAECRKIHPRHYRLALTAAGPAQQRPLPGQFYSLRCGHGRDPLLRRPFSVHRIVQEPQGMCLEFLFRVVGPGTTWLSGRTPGEYLDVLGPWGNGFHLPQGVRSVLLVARGIGIAPLYALALEIQERFPGTQIHIIMGARSANRLFYTRQLAQLGTLHVYTDDGSAGFKGRAPDLLADLLERRRLPGKNQAYACGPVTMLRELTAVAERASLPVQVALEEHMGCGFGACLSCAIPLVPERIVRRAGWEKPALQLAADGTLAYSLLCRDGPIYDIREIDWDAWIT